MTSPVRLGVSPTASSLIGFFSQRFCGFISLHWNPGLCSLSHSPVVPPGFSTCKCGTAQSASHCLAHLVLQLQCIISASPTGLDECFSFNSLVVRLPYSLIFFQFWLYFVFKFVVLFVMEGGIVCLHMPPSWLEVYS